MMTYLLRENVLSDNTLSIPETGKIFKGGFIAIIEEYTYQTAWTDKVEFIRFKSEKQLEKFLNKNYPQFQY